MHAHTHINTHTYSHTNTHTHIHTHKHRHTHIDTHTHTHTHILTHKHTHTHTHVNAPAHPCRLVSPRSYPQQPSVWPNPSMAPLKPAAPQKGAQLSGCRTAALEARARELLS